MNDLVCDDVVLLGNLLKLPGDRDEDLGEDDGLHAIPGRVVDGRRTGEDMVDGFVVPQGEQNLITPASVTCRREIQNSRDKRAIVMYSTCLCMEHGDDGSITP
jgi:hypothetical protein